jgi:hypothetical protein
LPKNGDEPENTDLGKISGIKRKAAGRFAVLRIFKAVWLGNGTNNKENRKKETVMAVNIPIVNIPIVKRDLEKKSNSEKQLSGFNWKNDENKSSFGENNNSSSNSSSSII